MTEFYKYWDEVLKSWRMDGEIPESQKFWFEEQGHLNLHSELMPEPYWGDIDNNSVVFINFNPAGAEYVNADDSSHIIHKDNPKEVCGWLSPEYSKVAKTFPLLDKKTPVVYEGADWWKERVKWLSQFGIEEPDLRPFAIELCPWHSKKWIGGKYRSKTNCFPEINAYIKEYFGPWFQRAMKGSKYHLALCIGKEFAEYVIPTIWPTCRYQIIKEDFIPVDGNARKFWIFKIKNLGHIICTSARGSNKIPSSETFEEWEKETFGNFLPYF